MKFIIHRGADEIGGTCVEVSAGNTRVLLDFGMPLGDGRGGEFDEKSLEGKAIAELISDKKLYPIKGLYRGEAPGISAILISHSHKDHHGFLKFANQDIPVYMSEGTHSLMDVLKVFIRDEAKDGAFRIEHVRDRKVFDIGDIRVTPFLVDHSAFDAMAFLLEDKTTGKRLFYTGDFRATGWKGKLFDRLVADLPKGIDCLLMEGTMMERESGKYTTEQDILDRMVDILGEKDRRIVLAYCSGQNIDRIVAFYKAARKAGALLVLDPYTACVLSAICTPRSRIPQMDWGSVRVLIADYGRKQRGDIYVNKIAHSAFKGLIPALGRAKIKPQDFSELKQSALVLMRNTMIPVIEKMPGIQGSKLVYSQWQGYLKKDNADIAKFKAFLVNHDLELEHVHTSGHATVSVLQAQVAGLAPKCVIPIHTQHPSRYRELWGDLVRSPVNGEMFELP